MIKEIKDITAGNIKKYLELPDSVKIETISGGDSSNGWDKFIRFNIIPKNSPGEMSGKHDDMIRKLWNLKDEVVPFVHAAPNFGGGITVFFKYDEV